jgi:spore germination cell wall hydrolase CwlJ-like protein
MPNMDANHLLASVLFSETKDLEDAKGIANVIKNRMSRPERFGGTLEEVVLASYQFSGVGTEEFNKAANLKFKDKNEEKIFKQFLSVASSMTKGGLEDNTNGADHYVNLKISRPKWSKVYPKTAKISEHTYYKEVIKK